MPLSGDRVFCLTMQNKEVLLPLVRELLEDPDAEILEIRTQETFDFVSKKLANTNSVTLDVVARMATGEIVNVELQKRNDGRGPIVDRAWIYAAIIATMSQVGKGAGKYNITRTLVCFLCGYNWRAGAGPKERIVLYNETARMKATDNLEIVMVCYDQFLLLKSGAIQSLCSELAEQPDSSTYAKMIRDTVRKVSHLKSNQEEVRKDRAIRIEDAMLQAEQRGVKEGERLAKEAEQRGAIQAVGKALAGFVVRGTITFMDAVTTLMKENGISEDEASDVVSKYMM